MAFSGPVCLRINAAGPGGDGIGPEPGVAGFQFAIRTIFVCIVRCLCFGIPGDVIVRCGTFFVPWRFLAPKAYIKPYHICRLHMVGYIRRYPGWTFWAQ